MPQHAAIVPMPNRPPDTRAAERIQLAHDIHEHLDSLLVSLRLDLAWLDHRLAEQAGSTGDEARTLRLEMRIRCDGMGDQLDRATANLERIVAGLDPQAARPR